MAIMSASTTRKQSLRPLGKPFRFSADAARLWADALVPPACPICAAVLAADDGLCADCWAGLDFITAPICRISGVPLPVDLGDETLSLPVRLNPPPYARARAALHYRGSAASLIKNLKFGDRPELARLLAGFMVAAGQDVLPANALLLPVPLHRRRLLWRRFNQAAELCRAIAAQTGHAVLWQGVKWVRPTRQQIGLTRAGRKRNLAGAFDISAAAADAMRSRTVVIVDDVLTTGATVEAIAKRLKRAEVGRIYVLTAARVVMPSQVIIS